VIPDPNPPAAVKYGCVSEKFPTCPITTLYVVPDVSGSGGDSGTKFHCPATPVLVEAVEPETSVPADADVSVYRQNVALADWLLSARQ